MREHFHVPDNYFLSHSVGCLPKRSLDVLKQDYIEPWKDGRNWEAWMPLLDTFRSGVANLLGVRADNLCPQSNISSGLTKILYSLPEQKGRKTIVLSEQDFPTVGFVFKQAERSGFNIKFVSGSVTNIENWEAAIDDTVAVVHVTHALSDTSTLLPVREICELARQSGSHSIVDVAQSLGVVPANNGNWNADFITGTGVKFLCFGAGACFLYVSNDMLEICEPIDVGWFSHENPYEMDIRRFHLAKDAMRYFGGTPSPAPIALAGAAINLWNEIGTHNVHAQIQLNLDKLVDAIPNKILVSPRKKSARGATLVVEPDNRDQLRDELNRQGILFDERKAGFRFSMHGYTPDIDIDRLLETLT